MPPSNTPLAPQQSNDRKRAATDRVVPVIPLALSKPKPQKSKPKAEADVRVGEEGATPDAVAKESLQINGLQIAEPAVNGEAPDHPEAKTVDIVEHVDEVAEMPSTDTPGSQGSGPMSISNGGTPDVPTTESTRLSTPPPTQNPPETVSPVSSRKPMERFDMRQIRTELPPAFVPSAEQHSPKSAASSQSNRPQFYSHVHPVHPSANGIVFGGQDSSTSSPAPPLSASSAFAAPPYTNAGALQQPYFMPQGHSHHTSEPHPQRTYHPGYPQPTTPWYTRQGYGHSMHNAQYSHPHGHMQFRYPPREVFTPGQTQQRNGRPSRSHSRSHTSSAAPDQQNAAQILQSPLSPSGAPDSSRPGFPELKAAFPGNAHPRQSQFYPQMPLPPPLPQYPHPDITSSMENAEAIRSHVQAYFHDSTFADCRLQVSDELDNDRQIIASHRIVLSRSQTLLKLMQKEAQLSTTLPAMVEVSLRGQYISTTALTEALNYIYGGPLMQLDHHRPASSSSGHVSSNVNRMEKALRYVATGAWLRLPAVASRGVEVAGGLLHWDTITTALTFTLEGGLSHIWAVEDGSEDRASTSSSDDSLGRIETTGAPTYDPYSTHLLQRIVDFTVHVFPPNFYLDASAPELSSCQRLPPIPQGHESRKSQSDPRLSQIRFGEMTNEDHQRPSFATTTISSVLLSLPFSLLKCVLEHYDITARLGSETVASIMRQVVAEREVRRTKILKAQSSIQSDDIVDAQLIQNMYWAESVEPTSQHRVGLRLARRKVGIDTPPSSGACSERNK